MNNLEGTIQQRNIKEQKLEQSIKALVKELYRLQGLASYELLEDHAIAESMRDYWKNQQSGSEGIGGE